MSADLIPAPRPRRARRGLATAAVTLAAALAWTALGAFTTAVGQEQPIVIDRAHEGALAPTFTEPIFFLILGGDARSGNEPKQGMDSIHILGIDPVQRRAAIVGIPRDTVVEGRKITDLGRLEGIDGGFIDTVEGFSGCQFDYYMLTGFDGFRGPVRIVNGSRQKVGPGIIDDIGGVTVNVRENLTEPNPVPVPRGKNVLNGNQAISYARNRHQRARGDFDRSVAQGKLMLAVLAEMRRDFAADPGTAMRNIAAIRRHVRLDIPLEESLRLGLLALKIKPSRVRNIVLDGFATTRGSASVVEITDRGKSQLADVCSDGLLDSTS